MAKETPLKLSDDDMDPSHSGNPGGGIPPRGIVATPKKREKKVSKPMQFNFSPETCKAIRLAANNLELSYSEFMERCFHDFMKNGSSQVNGAK